MMMQLTKKEKWIGLFSLFALTFFLALSCLIHSTVENLDDEDLLTKTEDRITEEKSLFNKAKGALRSATTFGSLTLRQRFLEKHGPLTEQEIFESLSKQRKPHPGLPNDTPYDIFNCAQTPPAGYPFAWNALQVLKHWNVDITTLPEDFLHQGLCVFDWRNEKHREIAQSYREAELPFVLSNHPEVNSAAYRWSTPGYVQDLVGDTPQRNEYSHNNHFMYWKRKKNTMPKGWTNPTENVELSFSQWLKHAEQVEKMSDADQVGSDHWYFRLNAEFDKLNTYVYDELPIFRPSKKPTTFMVDSSQERGINCRFGMRGVIAESHFDSSRNWIVLLSGQRRYILAHPDQCESMEMYPKQHPSGRHSSIDWSSVDEHHTGPFRNAMVNEVVLQAGDALYLPTYWLHFIVSLNINYQCNARSGVTFDYHRHIQQCGFI